ncbi:tetratricopeptide repeat protein 28-like, partial [Ruditapes philippinarum]|uniref:tetratricopeptide repeat protein 28-like n=1 Tax=Ruditapes philippinarum TaxID=129788 RepID=UPI00295B4A7B
MSTEVSNKKRHSERPDYSRQSSSGSTASHNQVQVHSGVSAHSQALFLQKVRESSEAVNRGDYRGAIQAYTEAISLDPSNHILYTNRAAAFAKTQQFQKSLLDARKSRELNPKWAKAYIREGSALQQLGQHADALAAFAAGLAQDTTDYRGAIQAYT